jgi:hypothetical protein
MIDPRSYGVGWEKSPAQKKSDEWSNITQKININNNLRTKRVIDMILNTIAQDFKFALHPHNEVPFQRVFTIFSFPS